MRRFLGVTLLGAIMACAAMAQERAAAIPMIVVTGTGEISANPDLATVRVGVVTRGATAAEAQLKSNEVMQKLLAALLQLKIEKKDVQTSSLTLGPYYDNRPNQNPVIAGYEARNTVSVKVRDLTLVGKVVDATVSAGGNSLEGVYFGLTNDKEARLAALKEAVAIAREKARAIADAMGVDLAGVLEVVEGGANVVPMPMYDARMLAGKAEGAQVEPGQVSVSASVTIKYAIRQR